MKKTVAVIKDSLPELDLIQEEIESMKEHFHIIDRQKAGFISIYEIGALFESVGQSLSSEKKAQLEAWIEEKSGSRKVDVNLALRAWSYLKELNMKDEEDEFDHDILNTFVAMGGNSDKTGVVRKQKLVDIIEVQFGLMINIDHMFDEAGLDGYDELNFYDFTCLLESGGSQRGSRICSIFSQASAA